jgi:hypothetical protein
MSKIFAVVDRARAMIVAFDRDLDCRSPTD